MREQKKHAKGARREIFPFTVKTKKTKEVRKLNIFFFKKKAQNALVKAREAKRDPSGKNGGKACVRELGSASKERDHVRFHFFSLHIKHSASSGGNALRV